MSKKNAFTLLELMIVVLFVAVVSSLAVNGLLKAMETSRSVGCVNNIKQAGFSWFSLVQSTPLRSVRGLVGKEMPFVEDEDGETWVQKAQSFGLLPEIMHCPEDSDAEQFDYGMNPLAGATWRYSRKIFGGFLLLPGEKKPRNFGLIKNPSQTIILAESASVTADTKGLEPDKWLEDEDGVWRSFAAFPLNDTHTLYRGRKVEKGYTWAEDVSNSGLGDMEWDALRRPFGRHEKKCSVYYIDGHVEQPDILELLSTEWNTPECDFDNE